MQQTQIDDSQGTTGVFVEHNLGLRAIALHAETHSDKGGVS